MITPMQHSAETLVFVYGTLRRGEPNHRLLARAAFVREARTAAAYELVDLGPFPAMVTGGASSIVGEIYAVDARVLADLDRLEGHPRFYRRTAVTLDDGDVVEAYLMPAAIVAGGPHIASGDWLARGKERRPCASAS